MVGQKQPNNWDLYDMHGNLLEWVWDGYRSDYENLGSVDPVYDVGPGASRVVRGGSWYSVARGAADPLTGPSTPRSTRTASAACVR